MEEHSTKRIKLSLEPFINKTVTDVTDTGHEVYKSDLSLPEQLMRNVDRVWYERGDWTDITEEGLQRQLRIDAANEDTTTTTNDASANSLVEDNELQQKEQHKMTSSLKHERDESIVDLGKLRESVISKLYFAKCEIDVALDVINILSIENKRNANSLGSGGGGTGTGGILAGTNDAAGGISSILGGGLGGSDSGADGNNNMILPPGTLHATYVSKPRPTEKAQLEQAQLTLGLKRTQQKTAANYLKQSAASLKRMVDEEQQFWDQAVGVRSNHWLMQASGNTSGLWISYGFKDVGSDFPEACHGEMLRPDQDGEADESNQVRLFLPHNTSKQVRVTVKRNQTKQQSDQFGCFDLGQDEEKEETSDQGIYPSMHTQQDDSIQRRLIDAQSTVYDAELFSRVLAEAQILASNVRCEENCVIVTLDGEMDIVIQKIQYDHHQPQPLTNNSSMPVSSQQMLGRTIETALRLLLVQRHRFNLWKPRTRLFAGQRKIQLLLDSIEDTALSTGFGAKPAGNISHRSGSNLNGSNTPKLGPRTTSSASMTAATSSPSLSSFSLSRQLSSSEPHQPHTTRELTSNVPLLAPIISMAHFWILFGRIQDVVHNIVNPLCGDAGLGLAVHFTSQYIFKNDHTSYYDAYPSFGELGINLAISMIKGPSLRFTVNQTGTITAILPGSTVTLSNVTEFEAFLLREIKLICLHVICDIANNLIQRSTAYKNAKEKDREAYIWQMDEVEEILYGTVNTKSTSQLSKWKTIRIQLNNPLLKQSMPAYILQIQEDNLPPIAIPIPDRHAQCQQKSNSPLKHYILLSRWNGTTTDGDNNDLGFRDRVTSVLEHLLV